MLELTPRWQNAFRRSEYVRSKEVPTKHAKRQVFMVTSESQKNLHYQVIVQRGEMTCSCPAGMHNLPCKHKARVARELGVIV